MATQNAGNNAVLKSVKRHMNAPIYKLTVAAMNNPSSQGFAPSEIGSGNAAAAKVLARFLNESGVQTVMGLVPCNCSACQAVS